MRTHTYTHKHTHNCLNLLNTEKCFQVLNFGLTVSVQVKIRFVYRLSVAHDWWPHPAFLSEWERRRSHRWWHQFSNSFNRSLSFSRRLIRSQKNLENSWMNSQKCHKTITKIEEWEKKRERERGFYWCMIRREQHLPVNCLPEINNDNPGQVTHDHHEPASSYEH